MTVPRPLHPGRPGAGADVIPDGWAAAHQPVVEATFDCSVTVGPASGPLVFNPATGVDEADPAAAVYTGPASIGLATIGGVFDDRRVESAGDEVDVSAYRVRIPATATGAGQIQTDHVVTVTASPSGALVGSRLIVTGISTPGREFSRVISARIYT